MAMACAEEGGERREEAGGAHVLEGFIMIDGEVARQRVRANPNEQLESFNMQRDVELARAREIWRADRGADKRREI